MSVSSKRAMALWKAGDSNAYNEVPTLVAQVEQLETDRERMLKLVRASLDGWRNPDPKAPPSDNPRVALVVSVLAHILKEMEATP